MVLLAALLRIIRRLITEENVDQLFNLSYQSQNIDKLLGIDHGEDGTINRCMTTIKIKKSIFTEPYDIKFHPILPILVGVIADRSVIQGQLGTSRQYLLQIQGQEIGPHEKQSQQMINEYVRPKLM